MFSISNWKRVDLRVLFIFLTAVFIRFLFFFSFIWSDPKRAFYTIDAYTYEFPAINLIEKRKYINDCPRPIPEDFPEKCVPSKEPEIYRPPVFPLFIALHYLIFGEKREFVILSLNIIDSLKIFLIYAISKQIGLTGAYLYIPSILYAVSPSAIIFSQTFMTEPLQSFFLLLLIFFILRNLSALSGITAGILSLTHPIWLFFSYTLPFIVLLISRSWKKFFISAIFFVLTISPWLIRNYLIWKILIFRPGGSVFLCEIRMKMYKGKWVTLLPQAYIGYDIEVLNKASEKFGWGVKFTSEEDIKNFNFSLTMETQIASVCREDILRRIWKYPFELHISGFLRSLPPFGIAMLYYMIKGDIKPSEKEITRYIIPYVFEGRIIQAFKEIKERRIGLLPTWWWVIYILAWVIRLTSLFMALLSILKIDKKTYFLIFIFIYGTFVLTTFESAQPRRFYTVEPIIFILTSAGLNILLRQRGSANP